MVENSIEIIDKKEDYPHLNKETIEILFSDLTTKINWVLKEHFVAYEKAKKILRDLTIIMQQDQKPGNDLFSMLLVGDSGTGKTSIIKCFLNIHQRIIDRGDYSAFPVIHCILSDASHGPKAVYYQILKQFNYPINPNKIKTIGLTTLENACIGCLRDTEVRVLILDEFQHALGRSEYDSQAILNSLKKVLLEAGVPLVPVGTEDALKIIARDNQIAKRCRLRSYSYLKPWKYDDNFKRFLTGYEKFLPFREPSNLALNEMSKMIFNIAYKQGNYHIASRIAQNSTKNFNNHQDNSEFVKRIDLRNITEVIKITSRIALTENSSKITLNHLKKYKKEYL
ncbi:MAG: TniB family NTP-binding protein [Promethearchaeota archaeon]